MTTLFVPSSAAEITPEWMNSVLAEGDYLGGARVTNVTVTEIGAGRGFIGQTLRVAIDYDQPAPGAPASLVAKLPTAFDYDPTYAQIIALLYTNEIQFYRDLAADCPIRVPISYWHGMNPEQGRYCLLLEDMGSLSMRDQLTSCDDDTARMVVRSLADIHARWWENPELKQKEWISPPELQAMLITGIYEMAWANFAERLGSKLDPRFMPIGERLRQQLPQLVLEGAASASTLAHGDYRIENFMFGELGAADELVVLDWQTNGRGSGLRDLAYFTSQSLSIEARRRLEEELLRIYYDRLGEKGVTGYSFEQCLTDYKRGLLIGMYIPVNGVHALVTAIAPEDPAALEVFQKVMEAGEALVAMIAERGIAAIVDNDAASVMS